MQQEKHVRKSRIVRGKKRLQKALFRKPTDDVTVIIPPEKKSGLTIQIQTGPSDYILHFLL